MPSNTNTDLQSRLDGLQVQQCDDSAEFYAITLTASDAGQVEFATQTRWTGFADEDRRIELRRARLVYAKFSELWQSLGQPFIFVENVDDMTLFLLAGGNALISRALGEAVFGSVLGAEAVVPELRAGFRSVEVLEKAAFRRAPTPKLRMKVFDRDGRRCRICGRQPENYTDVELHIHHIKPWAIVGFTEAENLVTLCHTCHSGLEPHYDSSLYDRIGVSMHQSHAELRAELVRGVMNYRRVGFVGSSRTTGT